MRSTYSRVLGPLFHKVSFRWTKGNDGYRLQVTTTQNYGYLDEKDEKRAQINYYVTKLWDTSMMTKEEDDIKARKTR